MMYQFQTLIQDANTSDGELIVEAAFDRSPIGAVQSADSAAVEIALSVASQALDRSNCALPTRLGILKKAAELMSGQ